MDDLDSSKPKAKGGRRPLRSCLLVMGAILAVVLVLIGAGLFLLSRGSVPLVDGARLAEGRVEIVADHGFIAAYLVFLEDGGVALIDATMDSSAGAIRHALSRNELEPGDVRAIFLTHGHGDHIAGARSFPDADVLVLEPDADLTEGRRSARSLWGRRREARPTGLEVTRGLGDGDIVRVGGTEFEVFALPGHTLGSAAYLAHGVLFFGDAAAARSDGRISGPPPLFSWDRNRGVEALHELVRRLRPRRDEIEHLAFGHQGPLEGPRALLAWDRATGENQGR